MMQTLDQRLKTAYLQFCHPDLQSSRFLLASLCLFIDMCKSPFQLPQLGSV